jgi:hypothetical protein
VSVALRWIIGRAAQVGAASEVGIASDADAQLHKAGRA